MCDKFTHIVVKLINIVERILTEINILAFKFLPSYQWINFEESKSPNVVFECIISKSFKNLLN